MFNAVLSLVLLGMDRLWLPLLIPLFWLAGVGSSGADALEGEYSVYSLYSVNIMRHMDEGPKKCLPHHNNFRRAFEAGQATITINIARLFHASNRNNV